jgi:hypothetical protein
LRPPAVLTPVAARPATAPAAPRRRWDLADRVAEALDAAGMAEGWQAAQALDLAVRIEDGSAKGSALAALHRELRSVMAEVLRGSDDVRSSVGRARNELAERRARRAGGGAS